MEVEEEQLSSLAKKITETTRKNVIVAPGLSEQKIKVFIRNTPFASAMDKLAYSNNLLLRISDDGFYILEKQLQESPNLQGRKPILLPKQATGKRGHIYTKF
jgi:type IV pilus assembly protein PilQ